MSPIIDAKRSSWNRRIFIGPAIVCILAIQLLVTAFFSLASRVFSIQRYATVLGDERIADLSRLTVGERSLVLISMIMVLVGTVWFIASTVKARAARDDVAYE